MKTTKTYEIYLQPPPSSKGMVKITSTFQTLEDMASRGGIPSILSPGPKTKGIF